MNNQIIYIIITLPKDGFGIYEYLFEFEDIDAWLQPENREVIEKAFYFSSGVNKDNEPIIDIKRTGFISFTKDKTK